MEKGMTDLVFWKVHSIRATQCPWKPRLRLHREQWFFPEVQLGDSLKSSVSFHVSFMFSSRFACLLNMPRKKGLEWHWQEPEHSLLVSLILTIAQLISIWSTFLLECLHSFFSVFLNSLVPSTAWVPKHNRSIHWSKFLNNLCQTESTMEHKHP